MKKIQIFILGIAFYFLISNINFVDILSRPKPMEEIVQEEFFEKSYKDDFDSLFVLSYRDSFNKSTSNPKIIEELLNELYKLELDKIERPRSIELIELWFSNEQDEYIRVNIMEDGNIAIGTKTYDYIKDEENKVIKHEYTDSERNYYKITSEDLDIEDIQKIIDKIQDIESSQNDLSEGTHIPEDFNVSKAVIYKEVGNEFYKKTEDEPVILL